MKTIQSKDNSIYKAACQLLRKKYRDERREYLLEGVKPVRDAIASGTLIKYIFLEEGGRVPDISLEKGVIMLRRELFRNLSATEHSQGVIAVAEQKQYELKELLKQSETGGNVVVLDRLQDPGNIGTIIRTAEAAGYDAVITTSGTADVYAPKVVRAAAGSLFRMPILQSADEQTVIDALREAGRDIVVTSLDTEQSYWDADLTENIALVIGNEGQGVSRGFLKSSQIKIKIPMEGEIESLNAAVAAGILMYQSKIKSTNK